MKLEHTTTNWRWEKIGEWVIEGIAEDGDISPLPTCEIWQATQLGVRLTTPPDPKVEVWIEALSSSHFLVHVPGENAKRSLDFKSANLTRKLAQIDRMEAIRSWVGKGGDADD